MNCGISSIEKQFSQNINFFEYPQINGVWWIFHKIENKKCIITCRYLKLPSQNTDLLTDLNVNMTTRNTILMALPGLQSLRLYEFCYLAWCGWSMIALIISFKGFSSLSRCSNKPRKHTRASSHWPRVRWLQNAVNSCWREVSSSRSKGWLNGSCSLILGCNFIRWYGSCCDED